MTVSTAESVVPNNHEGSQSTTESTHTAATILATNPAPESSGQEPPPGPSACRCCCSDFCSRQGRACMSNERFCWVVPAKYWLKIRLIAVCAMLVGLFLLIMFPLPDTLFFKFGVVLIAVGGLFVTLDIIRGIIANQCFGSYVPTTNAQRGQTIEVTGDAGYGEHENLGFAEDDRPPDYATAMATSQRLPDIVSRPQPLDVAISMDAVDGTSHDQALSPDVLPGSTCDPASPQSTIPMPAVPNSTNYSQEPPPSYDDVIKENNRQQSHDPGPRGDSDGSSGS